MTKSKLKARMLEYFREVERTGVPLVVTDHGREVLEIRPLGAPRGVTPEEVLARYRAGSGSGILPAEEELISPLPLEDWEVLRKEDRNPW